MTVTATARRRRGEARLDKRFKPKRPAGREQYVSWQDQEKIAISLRIDTITYFAQRNASKPQSGRGTAW